MYHNRRRGFVSQLVANQKARGIYSTGLPRPSRWLLPICARRWQRGPPLTGPPSLCGISAGWGARAPSSRTEPGGSPDELQKKARIEQTAGAEKASEGKHIAEVPLQPGVHTRVERLAAAGCLEREGILRARGPRECSPKHSEILLSSVHAVSCSTCFWTSLKQTGIHEKSARDYLGRTWKVSSCPSIVVE